MLPYVEKIAIAMTIVRLLCIIISYWRPSICKSYLLMNTIYFALKETAPINRGQNSDYYVLIELSLIFVL